MSKSIEASQVPLAVSLLPGQVPNKLIERVEDVMNATIREAVFVTEHLDSGEIESAMVALLQLKLNAELASKLIHDALGTLQKRRAQ